MGGKLYVGVGGTAAKVKKLYVGVNGVARKVKKLYVGVNGIARKVFGGGTFVYDGEATTLEKSKLLMWSASTPSYCFFFGGFSGSNYYKDVEAYNSSLTKTVKAPGAYSTAAYNGGGVWLQGSTGEKVIFGGGKSGSSAWTSAMRIINSSLTFSTVSALNKERAQMGTAYVGSYGIFFCGFDGTSTSVACKTVDFYDDSGTHTYDTVLVRQEYSRGCSLPNHAVFNGWQGGTNFRDYAYDSSKTLTTLSGCGISRTNYESAVVGGYALFAGGNDSLTDKVIVYNDSLTLSYASDLSEARYYLASASLNGLAIFVGGITGGTPSSPTTTATANQYDDSLTMKIIDSMTYPKYEFAGGAIGDYLLFAGGYRQNLQIGYTLASTNVEKYKYTE